MKRGKASIFRFFFLSQPLLFSPRVVAVFVKKYFVLRVIHPSAALLPLMAAVVVVVGSTAKILLSLHFYIPQSFSDGSNATIPLVLTTTSATNIYWSSLFLSYSKSCCCQQLPPMVWYYSSALMCQQSLSHLCVMITQATFLSLYALYIIPFYEGP